MIGSQIALDSAVWHGESFQSLIGILVDWKAQARLADMEDLVSIPDRDFS